MSAGAGGRRAELEAGLARVEERIVAACRDAGRPRADVNLIVVTKFFPAADVRHLLDLGVRDIGENRDQEARAKLAELADLPGSAPHPTAHMVGQVQTKKAASVLRWADVVHAVDRPRLVTALQRAWQRRADDAHRASGAEPVDVLLQVDLRSDSDTDADEGSGDAGGDRAGVRPADLPALVDQALDEPGLRVRGLMAVAPLGLTESGLERVFEHLAALADQTRRAAPEATWCSAGMSGDLEVAVRHGATHLRVGSAILGPRPEPR